MEQELRFGLDLATFEAGFFMFSWANFFLIFLKSIVASTLTGCIISLLFDFFLPQNRLIIKFSNLSVLYKEGSPNAGLGIYNGVQT